MIIWFCTVLSSEILTSMSNIFIQCSPVLAVICYCDFLRPVRSQSQDCSEQDVQDFGVCAFQLMGAVSAMEEKFGITAPILLLRGSVRFNTTVQPHGHCWRIHSCLLNGVFA